MFFYSLDFITKNRYSKTYKYTEYLFYIALTYFNKNNSVDKT